jgi:parallel beta-helix repeat protein
MMARPWGARKSRDRRVPVVYKVFSRALLAVIASLAFVGLAIPAIPAAAAGSVTSLTDCNQSIMTPGTYRLEADVTQGLLLPCFVIFANDVRLMLNGHTITEFGPADESGIEVFGSGSSILGPGTLSNWNFGIDLEGGRDSVRGVMASGNGFGIVPDSAGNSVRGNVLRGNLAGIVAEPGATGNTIIGNFAHGNVRVDLADVNPSCDSNMWRGNDFGTANQSCIH